MRFSICPPAIVLVATVLLGASGTHAADQLILGKKLLIKNPPAGTTINKLVHLAKDATVTIGAAGGAGDPQCTGAGGGGVSSIRIAASGGAGDVTIALPCGGWTTNGANTLYKYKDSTGLTCKLVLVKAGVLVKAVCKGAQVAIDLNGTMSPVAVVTTLNTEVYCTEFGGTVVHDGSNDKAFLRKDAAAPASCAPNCPAGQTDCTGTCVDLTTDPGNCGTCGVVCAAGESCLSGICVGCPAGQSDCGGTCVDLTTDPVNCGTCGVVCAAGESCLSGICVGCPAGQSDCGGTCVDLMTDSANCGTCGVVCAAGESCLSGSCAAGVTTTTTTSTTSTTIGCPARGAGEVGGACDAHADCDSVTGAGDGLCYSPSLSAPGFPPAGYCTLDDSSGTVCAVDADCGSGNVCADLVDFTPYFICLPACGECGGTTCPAGQLCSDALNGVELSKTACVPGNATAVDGDACGGFFDCNVSSTCMTDALEFPGGQCARNGCTVGNDGTCNGGHCVDVTGETPLTGTTCVDTCTSDGDCRQAEGYVCFAPGGGQPSYCRHPHVGDACADAAGCSGSPWVCLTSGFAGGYCTQQGCSTPGSGSECSPGSTCADPVAGSNYCADRCDSGDIGSQGRCRTGYQCADVAPGAGVVGGCVPPGSL